MKTKTILWQIYGLRKKMNDKITNKRLDRKAERSFDWKTKKTKRGLDRKTKNKEKIGQKDKKQREDSTERQKNKERIRQKDKKRED